MAPQAAGRTKPRPATVVERIICWSAADLEFAKKTSLPSTITPPVASQPADTLQDKSVISCRLSQILISKCWSRDHPHNSQHFASFLLWERYPHFPEGTACWSTATAAHLLQGLTNRNLQGSAFCIPWL